jgi:hypothetical protein
LLKFTIEELLGWPVQLISGGLLDGIEYNGRHLLYVPAGGNWADEYPFDGYILYDQVLRAWGLRLLGTVANEPAWVAKSCATWLNPVSRRNTKCPV